MGFAIETVGAVNTSVAAAGAQTFVAANNQSFTVRAAATNTTPVNLARVSSEGVAGLEVRIRSPRLHDDVNGIRISADVNNFDNVFGGPVLQPLFSQDTLIVEAFFVDAPVAALISTAYLTVIYDDVPGIQGVFRSWAEVAPNIRNILAVDNEMVASATAGQWGPTQAINAGTDVFKANTLYAILGYVCQVGFGAVTWQGVDIGNLQVGGPGTNNARTTKNYFVDLSNETGRPCIPVINSQNKSTTMMAVSDIGVSTALDVTTIYAELSA